jgi:iron(III) transport system ATP-binding protein
MAEVVLAGLEKRFGATRAVDGVDLSVESGALCVLLGPSGCGKTTVLRLVAGFESPDAGTIEIAGVPVAGPRAFVPPERRRVGVVFQEYALFPHLDVGANVAFGGADRQRVAELVEMVGLAGLERRMPHELSGGQQQRVAVARALAPAPAVLLLDEPFSNLDTTLRGRLRGELRTILRAAGQTAVFVTHDQDEALSLADQVAVMRSGRVVQTAPPEDLYRRPADPDVAALVGEAELFAATVSGGAAPYELGAAPAPGLGDGVAAVVVLRPEEIDVAADPAGGAVVVTREYYGHDQMLTVRLRSGRTVRARVGAAVALHEGDRVTARARRDPLVFPAR